MMNDESYGLRICIVYHAVLYKSIWWGSYDEDLIAPAVRLCVFVLLGSYDEGPFATN